MGNTPLPNLVHIYELLAAPGPLNSGGNIKAQQYDDFIKLWKTSSEHECILANCCHYAKMDSHAGRLLLPINECAAGASFRDKRLQGRSEALAESIGELVWMIIVDFGILPVLEIATQMGSQDKVKLDALPQPWVSLYFPTASVYFVVGKRDSDTYEIGNEDCLLGWVDELYIADYGSPQGNDRTDIPLDWRAYRKPQEKVVLPNYFNYPEEYLTSHKGDIVAGYVRHESHWRLAAINGLEHAGDDDAIVKLYGISSPGTYSDAVRRNVEAFRPQLIARKIDPDELVDCQEHQHARQQHAKAVGHVAGTYVITLAYGLVTGGSGAIDHQEYDHASSFMTCLFGVPESSIAKLFSSMQRSQVDTHSDEAAFEQFWARIVTKLWDSIDVLKLPFSRQMMMRANEELRLERKELRLEREELRRKTVLLDALTKPVEALSKSLQRAVAEMTKIQGIYKWSFRGAYERAPLIAPVFIANTRLLNERFEKELRHNNDYDVEADARLALRGVIYAWLGHDLKRRPTIDTSFKSLFSTLTSERADSDVNELLATVIRTAGPDILDEWALDDFNLALNKIKRQLHTNLKSFTDAEILVEDLLFALPKLQHRGIFKRLNGRKSLLGDGRNQLPRVIDFVEFIASLSMAVAPKAWNKDGDAGIILNGTAEARTIALATDTPVSEAYLPTKLAALLSKNWKSELPTHLDASLGDLAEPIVGMMRLCIPDGSTPLDPNWDEGSGTITFTWRFSTAPLEMKVDLRRKIILIGE